MKPRRTPALLIFVTMTFLPVMNATNSFSADPVRTYTATMTKPHLPTAPNGGTDDYRCFLIDPQVQTDSLITTVEFLPQQRKLMHHAILFQVGKQDLASAITLDNQGDGWPCFGGTGVGSGFSSFLTTPWLSSWAPGRDRDVMPKGYATPIAKGDRIVIQIHYNLLAAVDGKIKSDQSSVRITALPAKGSTLRTLYAELVAAPVELACPVGVTGTLCNRGKSLADLAIRTSSASAFESAGLNLLCGQSVFNPTPSTTSVCDKKITANLTVLKAAPHMHLLGTSLKLILNPGTPREKIILDRAKYNFDDQSATVLKTPIKLKVGDTVRVICTFDPKLRSKIPELKKLAPRYVTWGEGSSDEMCLGVMGVSRG
ncbi:MAG: monooxygenase [Actinobacteria bacterium]|nr:monooxygenase [Actinomycetota bacterium]